MILICVHCVSRQNNAVTIVLIPVFNHDEISKQIDALGAMIIIVLFQDVSIWFSTETKPNYGSTMIGFKKQE